MTVYTEDISNGITVSEWDDLGYRNPVNSWIYQDYTPVTGTTADILNISATGIGSNISDYYWKNVADVGTERQYGEALIVFRPNSYHLTNNLQYLPIAFFSGNIDGAEKLYELAYYPYGPANFFSISSISNLSPVSTTYSGEQGNSPSDYLYVKVRVTDAGGGNTRIRVRSWKYFTQEPFVWDIDTTIPALNAGLWGLSGNNTIDTSFFWYSVADDGEDPEYPEQDFSIPYVDSVAFTELTPTWSPYIVDPTVETFTITEQTTGYGLFSTPISPADFIISESSPSSTAFVVCDVERYILECYENSSNIVDNIQSGYSQSFPLNDDLCGAVISDIPDVIRIIASNPAWLHPYDVPAEAVTITEVAPTLDYVWSIPVETFTITEQSVFLPTFVNYYIPSESFTITTLQPPVIVDIAVTESGDFLGVLNAVEESGDFFSGPYSIQESNDTLSFDILAKLYGNFSSTEGQDTLFVNVNAGTGIEDSIVFTTDTTNNTDSTSTLTETLGVTEVSTAVAIIQLIDTLVLTPILAHASIEYISVSSLFNIIENIVRGFGLALSDTVTITEEGIGTLNIIMEEDVTIVHDLDTSTIELVTDTETLSITDLMYLTYIELLTETITLTETETELVNTLTVIAETLTVTETYTDDAEANLAVNQLITITEQLIGLPANVITELLTITESVNPVVNFFTLLTELVTATETATNKVWLYNVITETSTVTESLTFVQELYNLLSDTLNIPCNLLIQINNEDIYKGWVLHPTSSAVTTYSNYDFNSIDTINDTTFLAKKDGIYKVTGSTDDSDYIRSTLRTAKLDFKTSDMKYIEQVYLGISTDGNIVLKVISDNGVEVWYEVVSPSYNVPTHRQKIGKGLVGRYFQFELVDKDAEHFDVDSLEFYPIVLSRKVR